MTDDEMIEAMARAVCKSQNRAPDRLTYITENGVTRPYGPHWLWLVDEMRASLEAIQPEIDRQIAEAYNAALEEAATIVERSVCAACRTNNVLASKIRDCKS